MTTTSEALLPCPFCGSVNLSTDDSRAFISCMACHAEGPANIGMGDNYAATAWNRRASIRPGAPVTCWEDPRVQKVYDILCSDEMPPDGQHWEGWTARRIVDALA